MSFCITLRRKCYFQLYDGTSILIKTQKHVSCFGFFVLLKHRNCISCQPSYLNENCRKGNADAFYQNNYRFNQSARSTPCTYNSSNFTPACISPVVKGKRLMLFFQRWLPVCRSLPWLRLALSLQYQEIVSLDSITLKERQMWSRYFIKRATG